MANHFTLALVLACASCAAETVEASRPGRDREPTGRSELGMFMKTAVNPPFSKLSFLLFHNEAEDGAVAETPADAAGQLARAATRLSTWSDAPGESDQSKSVFYDYAQSLKADALDLESAVRASKGDAAIKVFETLRRKCDSCHHFFRFTEVTDGR